MLTFILFFIGFFLLIKGADLLVDGGAAIAKRLRVSNLVTGLTIVAFGTSMPEFVVSITAGIKGSPDISLGNVIGSNISNVFLILGVAAAIYPFTVKSDTTWKEVPLSLLAGVVLFALVNDHILGGNGQSLLSMGDGIVLLAFFAIFMSYVLTIAIKDRSLEVPKVEEEMPKRSIFKSLTWVVLGIVIMAIGGNWIVEGATLMAKSLGVSEALIGLTIVAIGTSLPELATVVVASLKKHSDMAVGNVIGSNIFNIFWILGFTSLVSPIRLNPALNLDMAVLICSTVLLFIFLYTGKNKHFLSKYQGILMIVLYVVYVVTKVFLD